VAFTAFFLLQTLYFNGKLMIDPLSLSDIKGLLPAPHENDVEVKE